MGDLAGFYVKALPFDVDLKEFQTKDVHLCPLTFPPFDIR